jgi:hypothetical protein
MSDKYKIDVELVFFNVTYVVVNDKPIARVANARERGRRQILNIVYCEKIISI